MQEKETTTRALEVTIGAETEFRLSPQLRTAVFTLLANIAMVLAFVLFLGRAWLYPLHEAIH